MEALVFGQLVCASEKYQRRITTKTMTNHDWTEFKQTWKVWERIPAKITNGVYLGNRVLQNGVLEIYDFEPREYFSVALVAPDSLRNPVYVPIGCLMPV